VIHAIFWYVGRRQLAIATVSGGDGFACNYIHGNDVAASPIGLFFVREGGYKLAGQHLNCFSFPHILCPKRDYYI
jgi:hypothetical protein